MKSYIHLYRTNSEFTEVYNGPDYDEPWLSLTEENMDVNYNKTPPEPPKELTAITFEGLTWVTDIPATGGTATKDNCSYSVIAIYDDNTTEDVTNYTSITGELVVGESEIEERHEVGELVLTALYNGKSQTGAVYVYQEAYEEPDYSKIPLTFKIKSGGTITWAIGGENSVYLVNAARYLIYRINNGQWNSILSSYDTPPSFNVSEGDIIEFAGENKSYAKTTNGKLNYSKFKTNSVVFEIFGNIMSLIYGNDYFIGKTELGESADTFTYMFEGCTGLTSAENLVLPATKLAEGCYNGMFSNCSSLINTPELPATKLEYRCYSGMFTNCTNLIAAPDLPATTIESNCYANMFYNCASLISAPSILPATTLKSQCYNGMFRKCVSLTTAPELPATTLTQYCYYNMFNECSSLNYIKAMFKTTPSSSYTSNWVNGVSPNGTFIKNSSATWNVTGANGIPEGWTVELDS